MVGGERDSGGTDVTSPGWLDGIFATLMMLIAVCCASRMAIGRLRGRTTEFDADGLHVLMGVAMAGMFEPGLSPVPDSVWWPVFAITGAWFSWRAVHARRPTTSRCAHPAPHAVECSAMVYMLLPAGTGAVGHLPGRSMPGMAGSASSMAGNPALALILALFMLGYILWTTDRLASASRTGRPADARASRHATATPSPAVIRQHAPATVTDTESAGRPSLAPRFAASYKIAMSIAMGYMLVMML